MANVIKPKRSSTAAKVPTTSDLVSGEIGVNMADQKVYINNGTSIVQVGAGKLTALGDVAVTSPSTNQTLAWNGTSWVNSSAGTGTVTSVDVSGGTTGLTTSGGPVTTSGTITMAGTLNVANGGTGATTAATALSNLGGIGSITSTDGSVTVTGTGTTRDLSVAVAASTTNVIVQVRNMTGATLTKGTAVYISGATGQIPTVSKALASADSTSAQTLGLINADLSNAANGYVTIIGLITNIDTSAYTDGAQLYLSGTTAGTLTSTKPKAPTHLVYVAVVEYAHVTQGKLFVKVQNGYELDEIHDVQITTPVNGNTLIYDETNSLWKNALLTAGSGVNITNGAGSITISATGSGGTVTSVGQSFTGGLISVSGSPVTTNGTLALTVAGTSGGIPYFSSASTWASSAALAANSLMIGGGAGVAPSTITTGTGVTTALGVNTGTAGAFVVNGGALGTPSSGTVTNLTGTASININGTVGATTPSTGAFTTLSASSTVTFSGTTTNISLGTSQSSGTWTAGGTSQTGIMTLGRSTGNQTTNIQAGATASGNTKTINIGTAGLSGSTTAINIGSAVSGATSTATLNGLLSLTGYYKETVVSTTSSGTYTFDLTTGTIFFITLLANTTFTFPSTTAGISFILFIQSSGYTATWPTAVEWPSGVAPTLTATSGSYDKFVFTSSSAFWFGSTAGFNYIL